MSDSTNSDLDSGMLNSDRVTRDVSRDQQREGVVQREKDQGEMLVDDDQQPDAAAGVQSGYRADVDTPDIGEPGSPGSDVP